MIKIAPSILSADLLRLKEELVAVSTAGADMIHIDVMDGHFVPNISMGPMIVAASKRGTNLPLDAHLMVASPERYIDKFVKDGADIITIHIEACIHLQRTIEYIKKFKCKCGVVLNPATPLCLLEEILPELDMVLLMSVNPGFGGQDFIPSSISKIKRLKEMIISKNLYTQIEVDGGITIDNSYDIINAGADILVAGTSIFHSKDYKETIRLLKNGSINQPT